jgi:predicted MFS family arabinose efflux permease
LGYIVTATFLVAIVRQNGDGPALESVVWLVTGLVGIPSVYIWSLLARRIGLALAFSAACLLQAIGVVASVAFGGQAGPILGGILLGGTFIGITALGLQIGRAAAPSAPRRMFAVMTVSFSLGQIAGPTLAGLAAQAAGSYVLPSLGAALALVIAALLVARVN